MVEQELTSATEFEARGRTVNGRFEWLDSSVKLWQKQGKTFEPLTLMSWQADLYKWHIWYVANIENTPIFPVQGTGDLDAFDRNVQGWRTVFEAAAGAKAPGGEWKPVSPPGIGEQVSGALGTLVTLAVVVGVAVVASNIAGRK